MVFLDNICLIMAFLELFSLSLQAESKRAEKCLSPPMRVANKLTPEPKSKMTETKPKHKLEQFQDKTLQLLVPNSKRLGATLRRSQEALHGFAQESTQMTLDSCSTRLRENKTRLPELYHEVLGGLPVLGYFCNQR